MLYSAVSNVLLCNKEKLWKKFTKDDISYVDICIVDGGLLLQPLANQAQSASARSKPDLVVKVAGQFYCCSNTIDKYWKIHFTIIY